MPVNLSSSQPPSSRWVSDRYAIPRSIELRYRSAGFDPGQQRKQRPGGLRRRRGAPAGPRLVHVGTQVLAPAAVFVLVRDQPGQARSRCADRCPAARPRPAPAPRLRCRTRSWRPTGRTTSRPAPGCAAATRRRAWSDSCVGHTVRRQHLHDVRGDVRRRRVDHLAEVAERQPARQSCWCCRRRTRPSRRPWTACRSSSRTARSTTRVDAPPDPGARLDAARARSRRCRRCPGRRRWRTRTPSRQAPPPGRRTDQSPGVRISSFSSQRSSRPAPGRPAPRRRRAARWRPARCPTPGTGRLPVGVLVPATGLLVDGEAVEALEARPPAPGGPAGSPAGAAPSSSRPTAAGCRPSRRRPPGAR